jgi:DNA-binding NarL/FixJ family response regulator
MKRIAIIEPCPILGLGFQTLFERHVSKFHIAGLYTDILSFRKQLPQEIDIILLNTIAVGYSRYFDIRELLPDYDDALIIALTTELLLPGTLASFDGALHLYDDGEKMVRELTAILESAAAVNAKHGDDGISERDKDIIIAIAKGHSNKDIADSLHLSLNSVMTYRKRIASKLSIKGTAGFTVYAMMNNLI